MSNIACRAFDWFFENVVPYVIILLFVVAFALLVVLGVSLCVHRNDPTTVERVAAKATQVVPITTYIQAGKVLVPMTTYSTIYRLISDTGLTCDVDAQTYGARNVGEMQPCRWTR